MKFIDWTPICARCGYDLRGLATDARCPECGLDVAESLDRRTLYDADPRWLRRLTLAALLPAAGVICITLVELLLPIAWVLVDVSIASHYYVTFVLVQQIASLTSWSVLLLCPVLLAKRPPDRMFDVAPRLRVAILLSAALVLAGMASSSPFIVVSAVHAAESSGRPWEPVVPILVWHLATLVTMLAIGATFVATCGFAAAVLRRVPRSRLPTIFRAAGLLAGLATVAVAAVQIAGLSGYADVYTYEIWTAVLVIAAFLACVVLGAVAARKLCVVRKTALLNAARSKDARGDRA